MPACKDHSKIRIVILTTVVCYWIGDDEHIIYNLYIDKARFVERVSQEFRKVYKVNCCGGSWSKCIKPNWKELVQISENIHSNCSNVLSAFLTIFLHCILDQLPSFINSYHLQVAMQRVHYLLITNN